MTTITVRLNPTKAGATWRDARLEEELWSQRRFNVPDHTSGIGCAQLWAMTLKILWNYVTNYFDNISHDCRKKTASGCNHRLHDRFITGTIPQVWEARILREQESEPERFLFSFHPNPRPVLRGILKNTIFKQLWLGVDLFSGITWEHSILNKNRNAKKVWHAICPGKKMRHSNLRESTNKKYCAQHARNRSW